MSLNIIYQRSESMKIGKRTVSISGCILSTFGAFASWPAPAQAAVFVVDRQDIDRVDLNPGDGKCEWFPLPNNCTLRAAVQEANALPGHDTIIIPGGWHIVLSRAGTGEDAAASGDLDITEEATIGSLAVGGFRPVVDANGLDRVFDAHAPLTLSGVQVVGGNSPGVGGGIFARANVAVDLSDCRIAGNSAGSGGGLFMESTGAVFPPGNTITDCVIENNTAAHGAALQASARTEIRRSTIRGNHGTSAILVRHFDPTLLSNTTVAGNEGSGIRVEDGQGLSLLNVTVHGNSAAGLEADCVLRCGEITVKNSILASNGVADCDLSGLGSSPSPVDIDANNNLDSDGSCPLSSAFGDLPLTDPQLAELQWNGGATDSMVPQAGSPVVEAGDNATCQGADQRGAPRPLDSDTNGFSVCDIGAVEVLPCDTASPRITLINTWLSDGETVACHSITAGQEVEVVAGAEHTFRTRGVVVLRDGFSVVENATFSVIRDPEVGSSVTLP